MIGSLEKWEARLLGAAALTLVSMAFVVGTDAPPPIVLFGALAGWIAGGAVWSASRGGS